VSDQELLDEIRALREWAEEMEDRIEWCLDQIDILMSDQGCTHKKEELH